MGRLNVARVLRSPRFSKKLNITRRATTVSQQGLTEVTETTLEPRGVVLAGSPQPFVQDTDFQHAKNTVTVYVYKERLLDPSTGHQPDIVNHLGNRYVVRRVYDWSEWGPGWCGAECELMDLETADA